MEGYQVLKCQEMKAAWKTAKGSEDDLTQALTGAGLTLPSRLPHPLPPALSPSEPVGREQSPRRGRAKRLSTPASAPPRRLDRHLLHLPAATPVSLSAAERKPGVKLREGSPGLSPAGQTTTPSSSLGEAHFTTFSVVTPGPRACGPCLRLNTPVP